MAQYKCFYYYYHLSCLDCINKHQLIQISCSVIKYLFLGISASSFTTLHSVAMLLRQFSSMYHVWTCPTRKSNLLKPWDSSLLAHYNRFQHQNEVFYLMQISNWCQYFIVIVNLWRYGWLRKCCPSRLCIVRWRRLGSQKLYMDLVNSADIFEW